MCVCVCVCERERERERERGFKGIVAFIKAEKRQCNTFTLRKIFRVVLTYCKVCKGQVWGHLKNNVSIRKVVHM